MNSSWLDERGVRHLCAALIGVQLIVAALNLAYIPAELREYEAWKTHIESPETAPSPEEPAGEKPMASPLLSGETAGTEGEHVPPPRLSLGREFVRYAKQQLDLDRECNFTTWLSSMQAVLVAFAALLLFLRTSRRGWAMMALGLLYFSIDESCQVHEWLGNFLSRTGLRIGALGPPYPWIIVLGPIFLAYAIGVLLFLNRELENDRRLRAITFAGILLMASSLPLEAIGGQLQGAAPRPPRLEVIAEETVETLGLALLLYAFMTRLARGAGRER